MSSRSLSGKSAAAAAAAATSINMTKKKQHQRQLDNFSGIGTITKRQKKDDVANKKIVTPDNYDGEDDGIRNSNEGDYGTTRRLLEFDNDDDEKLNDLDDNDAYYTSSDDNNNNNNNNNNNPLKKTKNNDESSLSSKQLHLHASLDYLHRGRSKSSSAGNNNCNDDNAAILLTTTPTMKAYRFIRKHYLIPNTIETDYKFGPHSGSTFEDRVIRAYTLNQLIPRHGKKKQQDNSSSSSSTLLLVCSYCGNEGHNRNNCVQLL